MKDRTVWRSRWAAAGAAIAVSIGGGGVFLANAAPGPSESTIVSVTPTRIMDTRNPTDLGLAGPFVSPVSQKLQVSGAVPVFGGGTATVVPAGATGVLLNVTSVGSTANGFISIRPGDAVGAPTTSSLNVTAGVTVPNSVQVALPTAGANAGKIDITYDALGTAGPTTEILIDVVGYTTSAGLQQLVADVALKANTADVYNKTQLGAAFVSRSSLELFFGQVNTYQVVAEVNLPAGTYVVTAKVVANNNSGSLETVSCSLRLNANVIDEITSFPLGFAGSERAVIAFTSAGTLPAAGTANVICRSTTTFGSYRERSITVIQVAGLTGTADT